jgi:uncharacterized membrane protein YqjE
VTRLDESRGSDAQGGLLASARALVATLIAIGHNRLELFSVEIQEEIDRVASLLIWAVAALLLGAATVLMLCVALVLWVDPSQRWLAAGVLGLLFLAACAGAGLQARARLALKKRPFDATLAELAKDHDLLKR